MSGTFFSAGFGLMLIAWIVAVSCGLLAWRHMLRWRRQLPNELSVPRIPLAVTPGAYRREWTVLRMLLSRERDEHRDETDRLAARRYAALSLLAMLVFLLAGLALLLIQLVFAPWDLH